jgi:hypothetical protein
MKFNKTALLASLVAGGLLAGSTLQAQDKPAVKPPGAPAPGETAKPGGPGGIRQPQSPEAIIKDLGLNEDQTKKFTEAWEERGQKTRALRKDSTLSQEDRRSKAKEITEATNAKLKSFLTADQYAKYLKLAPGPRNRPGAGAGAVPAPVQDKPAAALEK